MTDMVPIPGTGVARRTGRAIQRSFGVSQYRIAAVNDEASVSIEKIEALTSTTGIAMSSVTRVCLAMKALETLAPEVSGRLAYLADSHLLAVGDSLADLNRRLRTK